MPDMQQQHDFLLQTVSSVLAELRTCVHCPSLSQEHQKWAAHSGDELAMILLAALPFLPEDLQPLIEDALELHMQIFYYKLYTDLNR
jgi:hypothetical protein